MNIWTSRHPLPEEIGEHEKQEILWPTHIEGCSEIWSRLLTYDKVFGVFPAQAIESLHHFVYVSNCVFSAVSEPIIEKDTGKTRGFKFIRWARIQ